jgi:hypothetical protein
MNDDDLVILSWRYAALVGIIKPSGARMTEDEVAADRAQWPHLIKIDDGLPVFDLDEGAAFMAELSGQPLAECRRVIDEEWPENPEELFE